VDHEVTLHRSKNTLQCEASEQIEACRGGPPSGGPGPASNEAAGGQMFTQKRTYPLTTLVALAAAVAVAFVALARALHGFQVFWNG
jgi:hypothetical protein